MNIGHLALTLLAALAGGVALMKFRIPGGMLLGATAAVAILNLLTPYAYSSSYIKLAAQIVTGAYIGCIMTRNDVKQLPKVVRPLLLVMSAFLLLNLSVGYFTYSYAHIDLITALFCTTPGGISDTPLVAMDMGADVSKVAAVQFIRMAYGMGILPGIVLFADKVLAPRTGLSSLSAEEITGSPIKKSVFHFKYTPLTLTIAAIGGILGYLSGIPGGTLVCALIATLTFQLKTDRASAPLPLRRVAQALSGSYIGTRITWNEIHEMGLLLVPILVLLIAYTLLCVGIGLILAKRYHMGLREAMLSAAPAGASEMALIAADMDVFSSKLLVIQVARLLIVLSVFPQLFTLILALTGG